MPQNSRHQWRNSILIAAVVFVSGSVLVFSLQLSPQQFSASLAGVLLVALASGLMARSHSQSSALSEAALALLDETQARQKIEMMLASTREETQQALDAMREGYLSLGHDWRLLHLNRAATGILAQAAEALVGRNLWEVYPHLLGSELELNLRSSQQDGQSRRLDHFWDPASLWLDIQVVPQRSGMLLTLIDKTQERQTQELMQSRNHLILANTAMQQEMRDRLDAGQALDASLHEANIALGAFDGGCFSLGQEARLHFVNGVIARLMGRTPTELVGANLWTVLPQVVDTEFERQYRAVVRTSLATTFSYFWAQRDRWLEIKLSPVESRVVGFIRDITRERKARETQLVHDQLFLLAPEFMCVAIDGIFSSVNPAAANLLRKSPEELTAKQWITLVHPEDREAAIDLQENTSRKGKARPVLLRFLRSRGDPVWVELSAISDQNATMFMIGRDVSSRINSETALRQSFQQLQTRNEELSAFAFVAAHDLQEPLRKIRTFGNMLLDTAKSNLEPSAQHYLSRMINAAQRMGHLIESLLNYSRSESAIMHYTSLNLNELVAEVIEDLEARIEESAAEIDVGPLPELQGDRPQITQLFLNLIVNALKFVPKGIAPQIIIRGEYFEKSESMRSQPWCRISVRDHGIGFEPEHADKIFSPFARLHSHDHYEGSGIGLSIVRSVVKHHGGSIRVDATPGQGACFVIELPIRHTPS
jgi:PAS domain S-box-containing protein